MKSTNLAPDQLHWPIISIDFEASGLGDGTYPIELGLAIWRSPDSPIEIHSTLIHPHEDWIRSGVWISESQKVHGIDPLDLAPAPHASEVLEYARSLTGLGAVAYCDGGAHDQFWLNRLCKAAGRRCGFVLGTIEVIWGELGPDQVKRLVDFNRSHPVPHRAGPDAALHLQGIAHAMGLAPGILKIEWGEGTVESEFA